MKEISVHDLNMNPWKKIAKEWMLVTAGNEENGYNTMTASWGHIGSIWGKGGGNPTVCVYLRPQRYTKEFVDREPIFTLSFFSEEYKQALSYLGSHSGRDGDKIAQVGMHPLFVDGTTALQEANLILVCKKLYHAPILESGFEFPELVEENYPNRDFHEMYIAKIEKVLIPD